MTSDPRGILVITGTRASGKTSVAVEVGRQLEAKHVRTAVVDLDDLCRVHAMPGFVAFDVLAVRNLVAAWPNFRDAGATHLVLAGTLRTADAIAALARNFPLAPVALVRLDACAATLRARLERRDDPDALREHLAELEQVTRDVERLPIDPFVVPNDGARVAEVAQQVIEVARW